MTDTVETNKVKYAVESTSIDFYDATKNEGRGGYVSVSDLKARMAEGKKVNKHVSLGKQVDNLEDAKVLMRASELGGNGLYGGDPYGNDDLEGTRIFSRRIVKIEEVA